MRTFAEATRYTKAFNLPTNLFSPTLDALLTRTNIQAVATFTSTSEHRQVVEMCAPRHIHVMMEKPLAVSLADAQAMAEGAKRGGIQLLVNYETTWYPGNQTAYSIVHDQHAVGDLRKIVVHDGHRGPKEIGCSQAFLSWLTDPVLNGGGAVTDFGCYGADLITWLMDGQRPTAVVAVTQHIKPDVYPKVEDEATIIVTYPHAQGILNRQARRAPVRPSVVNYLSNTHVDPDEPRRHTGQPPGTRRMVALELPCRSADVWREGSAGAGQGSTPGVWPG